MHYDLDDIYATDKINKDLLEEFLSTDTANDIPDDVEEDIEDTEDIIPDIHPGCMEDYKENLER